MYPPGYHHYDFVATNALGHMMYGSSHDETEFHVPKSCHKAIVVITGRTTHCFMDYIYVTPTLLL